MSRLTNFVRSTVSSLVVVICVVITSDPAFSQSANVGNQYVPFDGFLLAELRPAEIMTSPATRLYPLEVAEAWSLDNVGISLHDCESVRFVLGAPGPGGPPAALIISLNKPFEAKNLNPQIVRTDETIESDGKTCYRVNAPMDVVLHQPDPKTLIVSQSFYLGSVLRAAEGNDQSPLGALAASTPRPKHLSALVSIESVRPMANGMLSMLAEQIPPELARFTKLPDLLDSMVIRVDLENSEAGLGLELLSSNPDQSQEVESLMAEGAKLARQQVMQGVETGIEGDGPIPDATRAYTNRIANAISEMAKPKRQGERLIFEAPAKGGLALPALLVAGLAPAIQSARDAAVRAEAQRAR